ncbi:MAG: glycosyltransferase [Candidatus Kariarchaeaceae archaeon]
MARYLTLASTFPRWRDDVEPGFIWDLVKHLKETNKEDEHFILVPHAPNAKRYEEWDDIKIIRFPYWIPKKWQILCYNGGILPNLKKHGFKAFLQLFTFVLIETLVTLYITLKHRIDIIHAHWIVPQGLVARFVSFITRRPYLVSAHGGDIFTLDKGFKRALGIMALSDKSIITANSISTKTQIQKVLNWKKAIPLIPMGIELNRFTPQKKSKAWCSKFPEGAILVGNIGRQVPKKGLDNLVHAFQEIVKKHPNSHLILGGGGPENKKLRKLVDTLALPNVHFIGLIPSKELPMIMASLDIFVLPSIRLASGDTEGLGVVLIEAMASKVPVIGSNVGGITDLIHPKKTGLLFEPGNHSSLVQAVDMLIIDDKLRSSLADAGYKFVLEVYGYDTIAVNLLQVTETLLSKYST